MTSSTTDYRIPPKIILQSLLKADLLVLVKNKRSVILSSLLPLLILISSNGNKARRQLGGPLTEIAFAITIGIMATSMMGYALSVARDRDRGVFQRLRVTPAAPWMIMSSRIAVQILANVIIAVVVLSAGTIMYHLSFNAGADLLVLAVSLIAGAVFVSVGQAIVGLIKSSETVNAVGRIVFIALLLTGLFGTSGILGATFESFARWSPVGVVITILSGVLDFSKWSGHDFLALLVTFIYISIFSGIGIRWFSWNAP